MIVIVFNNNNNNNNNNHHHHHNNHNNHNNNNNNYNNNNNNHIQRRNSIFFFFFFFFTISSLRCAQSSARTLWPGHNRVQITCNTSSAHHVQHVVLRATWYEGTAQLLTLTDFKSHLFELYVTGRTIDTLLLLPSSGAVVIFHLTTAWVG